MEQTIGEKPKLAFQLPKFTKADLPVLKTDDLVSTAIKVETFHQGSAMKPLQVVIETAEQYQAAADLQMRVKGRIKEWEAENEPLRLAFREPLELVLENIRTGKTPLETLDKALSRGLADFDQRQREIAAKAERDRQAALKAEQDSLAKEHEAARAKQLKEDEDRRLEVAAKLEAEGRMDLAEHVLAAAPPPPAPSMRIPPVNPFQPFAPPAMAAPKVDGLSYSDNWKGQFPDPQDAVLYRGALLMLAQAALKDPGRYLGYLTFDVKTINAAIKASSGQIEIPGVPAFNDRITRRTK